MILIDTLRFFAHLFVNINIYLNVSLNEVQLGAGSDDHKSH